MKSDRLAFDPRHYVDEFRRRGFAVFGQVLATEDVARLRSAVASIPHGDEVRRRRSVYGIRNLLEVCPAVRELAGNPEIRRFVTPVLGEDAFAVRAIYFDKVPDANWALGWHQDSVISVSERRDAPEFVAWSCKAGVWQVQPPAEVLAKMIAVRVHLDDCGETNGPLRVIPSSHCHGWLDDEIDEWKQRVPEVVCVVRKGGVVTMCPLILHASASSQSPDHRRVIHIEYASDDLPYGLEWNQRVQGVPFAPTGRKSIARGARPLE